MKLALAGLAAGGGLRPEAAAAAEASAAFDKYFIQILDGYLRNARRTSGSFAVCDFPGGTILKSCVARSGKTYVSVARMLPALAAWLRGGRTPLSFAAGGETFDLREVLRATYRNAFDPSHTDYWEEPPADRATQRSVEAALVAWSLWLLGDEFVSTLTPRERANVQRWLASCTVVPERENNHAWFSAINQAARLALSARWPEFRGDEAWMLADVEAMGRLAAPGDDGWYTDSPTEAAYDYYNFWTFASHFLYWNRMVGARYARLAEPFRRRLRLFLRKAPHFFGANGAHVLFGRSLIYRWSVLMPLVEAYAQGMWPHTPGLLRAIVRRNFEFHWRAGAYDPVRGKLRETFSPEGTRDLREPYVDNGHPYWAMQAFSMFMIPRRDPFWSAREERLPVERGDYRLRFEGAQMLLVGTKSSGQVRWLQSRNEPRRRLRYRDQYAKFCYSSHLPFNILNEADRCAWDQALVFRSRATRAAAGRTGVRRGSLTADGLETSWWAQLGGHTFEVTSRIRVEGEFELRTHTVSAPAGAVGQGFEIVEGSAPLGLTRGERYEREGGADWLLLRSRLTGHCVASWGVANFGRPEAVETFDEGEPRSLNIVHPRFAVGALRRSLDAGRILVRSLHYASPRPPAAREILRRAAAMLAVAGG